MKLVKKPTRAGQSKRDGSARQHGATARREKGHVGTPAVYVLSDSTGNLARHMLAAIATQFPDDAITMRFHTFIRGEHRLNEVLRIIEAAPGPVCHAMVSDLFKRKIAAFCRRGKLPHCDLTGDVVRFLSGAAGCQPACDLPSLHRIDEGYQRRIDALEFALAHDDGLGLATLDEADIVLAGPSRTGKTPTSIYLAQQGYRVANVSLAVEVPPPQQLLGMRPTKVVGLIINAQQLVMIRTRREADWDMQRTSYGDPSNVEREIAWVRQLYQARRWPVLDVTDQAIEETAARIIDVVGPSAIATTAPRT